MPVAVHQGWVAECTALLPLYHFLTGFCEDRAFESAVFTSYLQFCGRFMTSRCLPSRANAPVTFPWCRRPRVDAIPFVRPSGSVALACAAGVSSRLRADP